MIGMLASGGALSMRIALPIAVALFLALPVAKAEPAGGPSAEAFVRGLADRAMTATADGADAGAQRRRVFRQLLAEGFDLDTISRFVLGSYSRGINDDDRTAFQTAFAAYLAITYADRLGSDPNATLSVTGSEVVEDDSVLVISTIQSGSGERRNVAWRLRPGGAGWRVIDVLVNGLSMAVTYRQEFASVLRANGGKVAVLSQKLQQKSRTLAQ
jgi:phospholipid transport system substrate-binding protein